jgi:hypothetical protein
MIQYDFEIELWPIDRPRDYPQNARKWSANAIEKVASSIREYGWRQPIVVDTHDVIVIGHLRRAAGRKAGMTECPVHVARNLTPEQIRGLRLADNRTHEESGWDFELLGPELMDLERLGFGLALTGFDEQELASAMTQKTDGLTDPDECPDMPEAPVSQPGDLWLLGGANGHRVLCSDATSAEAIERLCTGQKVDLAFCDCPYNVAYEGYTEDRLKIQGDRMNRETVPALPRGRLRFAPRGTQAGRLALCLPLLVLAAGVPGRARSGRLRGPLPDHLGQEHFCLGVLPVQVSARTDLLLPLSRAKRCLVRR